MESLKILTLFPDAERVQIELLVDRYKVCDKWILEIKEKWRLDEETGYYYKPGGRFDTSIVDKKKFKIVDIAA